MLHACHGAQAHDAQFAREVKERLKYLDKFETGFEYGNAMVNGNLSRAAGHIQDVLTKIQARLQWGSDKYACSDVERLSAEQNCEVIIAADEYYCKCVCASEKADRGCADVARGPGRGVAARERALRGALAARRGVVWCSLDLAPVSCSRRNGSLLSSWWDYWSRAMAFHKLENRSALSWFFFLLLLKKVETENLKKT